MKTELIRFRCTKEQRSQVEEKADFLGLTLSAYLTMLIENDSKKKERHER